MVVEDNDLNRKLFCDVLRANGFEVEPVTEGDKVEAQIRFGFSVSGFGIGDLVKSKIGEVEAEADGLRAIVAALSEPSSTGTGIGSYAQARVIRKGA